MTSLFNYDCYRHSNHRIALNKVIQSHLLSSFVNYWVFFIPTIVVYLSLIQTLIWSVYYYTKELRKRMNNNSPVTCISLLDTQLLNWISYNTFLKAIIIFFKVFFSKSNCYWKLKKNQSYDISIVFNKYKASGVK